MAERETGMVAAPRCNCLCHTGEASHVAPCKCVVSSVADGAADPLAEAAPGCGDPFSGLGCPDPDCTHGWTVTAGRANEPVGQALHRTVRELTSPAADPLADVRARHGACKDCAFGFTCDPGRLLAALDAERAEKRYEHDRAEQWIATAVKYEEALGRAEAAIEAVKRTVKDYADGPLCAAVLAELEGKQ